MILGNRDLKVKRVLIAEIGNNHEGDPRLALELVDAAAAAGADAVKVQVINPERLVNRSQKERLAQLTRFRLPLAVVAEMAQRAAARGMFYGEPGRVYLKKQNGLLVCARDKCLWIQEAVVEADQTNALNLIKRYDKFATVRDFIVAGFTGGLR